MRALNFIENVILLILYLIYYNVILLFSIVANIIFFWVKIDLKKYELEDSLCKQMYLKNYITKEQFDSEMELSNVAEPILRYGYTLAVLPVLQIVSNRDSIDSVVVPLVKLWLKSLSKVSGLYRLKVLTLIHICGTIGSGSYRVKKVLLYIKNYYLLISYSTALALLLADYYNILTLFSIFFMNVYFEVVLHNTKDKLTTKSWYLYVIYTLLIVIYLTSLYTVLLNPSLTNVIATLTLISLLTYGNPFVIGHELAHKKGRLNYFLSMFIFFINLYPQFWKTHNHIHHRHLGTELDVGSAVDDQPFYSFIFQQLTHYWKNKSCLTYISWVMVICLGFISIYLSMLAVAYAIVNWLYLEMTNFLEHRNLKRVLPEEINHDHSWDTVNLFSNMVLFNLGIHGDHHVRCRKWYYDLEFGSSNSHKIGYIMQCLLFTKSIFFNK